MEKVQMYFGDVSSAPMPRNFMLQIEFGISTAFKN
jgi:hypothetical protein